MAVSANQQMLEKVQQGKGFIAALDQSGGSTPKALKLYGVDESQYRGDDQMFATVHAMRTRIVTSPAFSGERVIGAILFENTLDREVAGLPSAQFIWQKKQVVPFLKVDKGLAAEQNGVQLMQPMPALDALLDKAVAQHIFGTKMRSVVKSANPEGIFAIVKQQFDVAKQIIAKGLVPIVEPEIDIHAPDKAEAEALLKAALIEQLDALEDGLVMLKLTLPESANFYAECVDHNNCLKVVALSGGYSREEANRRVGENQGMVASFSRALTEGLSAQQNDDDFNTLLDSTIESIYQASLS